MILSSRVGLRLDLEAAVCESHARNARQTVTLTREVSTELELSGNRPFRATGYLLAGSDPMGLPEVRCLESFVALPRLICKARYPNPFMV